MFLYGYCTYFLLVLLFYFYCIVFRFLKLILKIYIYILFLITLEKCFRQKLNDLEEHTL